MSKNTKTVAIRKSSIGYWAVASASQLPILPSKNVCDLIDTVRSEMEKMSTWNDADLVRINITYYGTSPTHYLTLKKSTEDGLWKSHLWKLNRNSVSIDGLRPSENLHDLVKVIDEFGSEGNNDVVLDILLEKD